MPISPVYCSHFTLGNQKVIFNSIIHTYFKVPVFTLSQNKTNSYAYPRNPPHLKNVITLPCKMYNFSFDWRYVALLQMLVALKKASCTLALLALKRTGCDVWQMECQVSNITANVQSDHLLHGYILSLKSPLINGIVHHALLKFSHVTTRHFCNSSVSRIGTRYFKKMKNVKNLRILQGSAVTFFRCGG